MTKAERKEKCTPLREGKKFDITAIMYGQTIKKEEKENKEKLETVHTNSVESERLSTDLQQGMSIPAVNGGIEQTRKGESR